jgi:hypothetical protein
MQDCVFSYGWVGKNPGQKISYPSASSRLNGSNRLMVSTTSDPFLANTSCIDYQLAAVPRQ